MQTLPTQASAVTTQSASELAVKTPGKIFWQLLVAILILSSVSYASISASRPKFNRSEIAYAEISHEMLQRNSYIVPIYRGVACIDKPVMNYWVIMPCFKAFGESGFTSRIPSLVAALACLAVLAVALQRVFGWQTALLSAAILASAQRYWEFATLCMTDMLLTFFDTATLTLLYIGLKKPERRLQCFATAAVSMGLATLTKGPVGMFLPAFAFFLYLIASRNWKILSFKQVAICLVVFIAVAAPWYVAAASAVTSGASIGEWLWHHNVERFFGSAYEWHHSPFYMINSLFSGFAPWSIFLPFAFVSFVRQFKAKQSTEAGSVEILMWIWVVLTTTFFTLSHGKMNYYDLPCFPAAATIVGLHVVEWVNRKQALGTIGAWLLTAIIFGGAAVAIYLLPNITQAKSLADWVMMPALLIAGGGFCAWSLLHKKPLLAYAGIFASLCFTLFSFSCQVAPAMAKQAPALEYLRLLKKYPYETRLALHADFATTIDWLDVALFETGRGFDFLSNNEDLAQYLMKPGQALVILPRTRYDQLPADIKAHTKVLEDRPYMYDKIDLKFLARRHGHLTGSVPLLLISNDHPAESQSEKQVEKQVLQDNQNEDPDGN